jgi:hypothetical protein
MHDIKRSDERFTFITKCQLDIKGTKYTCLVDNISAPGASIELNDSEQNHLQVGDKGTLHVLLLVPVTYLCEVVRINSKQVGLHFVETAPLSKSGV